MVKSLFRWQAYSATVPLNRLSLCLPCSVCPQHLTELQHKYKDKGVTIIGISTEDDINVSRCSALSNQIVNQQPVQSSGYQLPCICTVHIGMLAARSPLIAVD